MSRMQVVFVVVATGCLLAAGTAVGVPGYGDSAPFSLDTSEPSATPPDSDLPRADRLAACYPNPFNPRTTIVFELKAPADVDLVFYDLQGRVVRTLEAGGHWPAGRHVRTWDGRDGAGRAVAGGVYLCLFRTASCRDVRRVTLLK